ncbi:MAG: 50S ribosomal protein L6 [Fusobacteriaceae bacterium]|jgi:large subunit ribosomal protein L6|nr:50S ribosomal protein L6 [Fusobacteriaceae bacterium]
MSRIGKKPITVPSNVQITIDETNNQVTVKGAKGTLVKAFNKAMKIKLEDGHLTIERPNDEPHTRALHGTTRALLSNMVTGVTDGFKRTLTLVGVGYRAAVKGTGLELALGYSHPVAIEGVDGVTFSVEKNTTIHIEGIEKDVVGQVAANIRSKRPPEPYKGKGVRYENEHVRIKEGKKA